MEYWLNSPEFTGRLECKFQTQGGSTDEKLPMILETAREKEWQTVVVFGGPYWLQATRGQAAVEWLKRKAEELDGDRLQPFLFDEFIDWVSNTWQ